MKLTLSLIMGTAITVSAGFAQSQNAPGYAKEIAPIFAATCVSCHQTGGIGPMALGTYEDVRPWARSIREKVLARKMPPWHADAPKGTFRGDTRLSDADIARIVSWVDAGAPKGAAEDRPSRPAPATEWILGRPDLILTPDSDFEVAAKGEDEYRCFVIKNPLNTDRYVRATDIRPGAGGVVHHAIIWIDGGTAAASKDAADPKPGYSCFGGPGLQPVGTLGLWGPGYQPDEFPGAAYFLPAGTSLVLQTHYHKSGAAVRDRPRVGLYFANETRKSIQELAVVNPRFEIPAGAAAHEVRTQHTIPQDIELVAILPHMHLLGKSMSVTLTLADGTTRPLINVPDWDFNWQRAYTYTAPVLLPAGSRVDVRAIFDNSAANPRNPVNPPRPVRFGESTTDEMSVAYLVYVAR